MNIQSGTVAINSLTIPAGSTVAWSGGTVSIANVVGNLSQQGGVNAPGSSPGVMTVNGNYAMTSGKLNIEIEGTSDSQYDHLIVTKNGSDGGQLTLGGHLDVTMPSLGSSSIGSSYRIFRSPL